MEGGNPGLAWEQWRGQGHWVEGLEARQGSALVPWAPRNYCWLPSGAVRGPGVSVLPASSRNPKVGEVLIPQVNGNRKVKMKVSDA